MITHDDDIFTTVGELRALLEGMPDSATVSIDTVPNGHTVNYMAVLTNFFPSLITSENKSAVTSVILCEVGELTNQFNIK